MSRPGRRGPRSKRAGPSGAVLGGLLAFLAFQGLLTPAPVAAEDLPEATRRMAALALAEGRWEDLGPILGGAHTAAQRWPLLVARGWWRLGDAAPPAAPEPDDALDALTARRLAWLAAGGREPYPIPGPNEREPWPVLAALVADRQEREGPARARGSPADPLSDLAARMDPEAEARTRWFLGENHRWQMSVSYRSLPPTPEEVAARERAEELAARNGWLALAALAGLLLGVALWLWRGERGDAG